MTVLNNQSEIEEKILEYLSTTYLPVLDNNERVLNHLSEKEYYTGVTSEYIKEYILNGYEITNRELKALLFHLTKTKQIKSLYCNDIGKVVFEYENSGLHWGYTSHELENHETLDEYREAYLDIFKSEIKHTENNSL